MSIYIYISMCVCVCVFLSRCDLDIEIFRPHFDIYVCCVSHWSLVISTSMCVCVCKLHCDSTIILISCAPSSLLNRHLCFDARKYVCRYDVVCVCVCVSSSFPFVWVLVNSKSTTNPHTWYVLHVGKLEIASQSEPRYRFDSCMSSKFDLSSRKWHAVSRSTG